jgi:hypothetical protein
MRNGLVNRLVRHIKRIRGVDPNLTKSETGNEYYHFMVYDVRYQTCYHDFILLGCGWEIRLKDNGTWELDEDTTGG